MPLFFFTSLDKTNSKAHFSITVLKFNIIRHFKLNTRIRIIFT